mgnify:FL=1
MKYKFGHHTHGETQKVYPTLTIYYPFEKLSVINAVDDLSDLDDCIIWLKELITRDISDCSEEGILVNQPILWGSKKSQIADLSPDKKFIGSEEFDTEEFLNLCLAWREFLTLKR